MPTEEPNALGEQLGEAYRRTVANPPTSTAVRIESHGGHDLLSLRHLDALEDPPSLLMLRDGVKTLLPRDNLPEMRLEIHARTGFAQEFTHLSASGARDRPAGDSLRGARRGGLQHRLRARGAPQRAGPDAEPFVVGPAE